MVNLPQESKDKLANIPASIRYSNISHKIEHILNEADKGKKPTDFTGYGGQDVRELLKDVYKKCVYCESDGNLETEHYRAKAEVRGFDGTKTWAVIDENKKKHRGYYWLAYEITNLLWVCGDCNRGVGGKHNKFPIKGKYVFQHLKDKNEWKVNSKTMLGEEPLLLHPLVDNPEEHLKVDSNGSLKAINNSEKGDMTIKVCNLNRDSLWLNKRKKIIDDFFKEIHVFINQLIEYEENNIEIIESQKGLKKLVQFIEHLFFKKIAENKVWDKPFSSVYRAIYNDFDDFFEQSNINRVITSEEQRFLKKAFAHFKQRNEVIY